MSSADAPLVVPMVEFMYLVFARVPGESCRRRLQFWVVRGDIFGALVNSLVCWFCRSALGLVLFQNWWKIFRTRFNTPHAPTPSQITFPKLDLHSLLVSSSVCFNVCMCVCADGVDALPGCIQCRPAGLRWPGHRSSVSGRNSLCHPHRLHLSHGGMVLFFILFSWKRMFLAREWKIKKVYDGWFWEFNF